MIYCFHYLAEKNITLVPLEIALKSIVGKTESDMK